MNKLLDRSTQRQLLLIIVATAVIAVAVPLVTGGGYATAFAFQLMTWIVLAVSWSLFSGNTGYASFGHGVFFGVGTYITSALLRFTELPFFAIMVLAGIVTGLLALIVGLAVFSSPRFAGDLFGLITLAMAFIVMTIVSNTPFLDGGTGVFVRELVAGTWIGGGTGNLFIVATVLAGITAMVSLMAGNTRWGFALRSIRDDESVAESLGVPTYRHKVIAFAVSAALAGVVGAPQAVFLGYVEVGTVFALSIPLFVLMMAILGGMGRWWGAIIGAVVVVVLRESLLGLGSAEFAQIIVGLALILVIVLMPNGISGFLVRKKRPRPVAKEATS